MNKLLRTFYSAFISVTFILVPFLGKAGLSLSYPGPQTYSQNVTILPLSPKSSGGSSLKFGAPTKYASGFNQPIAMAIDNAGNIFVVDQAAKQVKKISAKNGAISVIGHGFAAPSGIAVDQKGNVFVVDMGNYSVFEIPADGSAQKTISTQLNKPAGIATDLNGNLYISNGGTNQIVRISVGSKNPVVIASGFHNPLGLALDGDNNIYVVDNGTYSVKEILAGSNTVKTIISGFNYPRGIFIDDADNLYISDAGTSNIIKVDRNGKNRINFGSGFNSPVASAVEPNGNLYVLEFGNKDLKKEIPTGGYFISPALPAGLSMDPNTGIISGTPLVTSPNTLYTITAFNGTASIKATISIQVIIPNVPKIDNLTITASGYLLQNTLSPVFNAHIYSYTDTVNSIISSIYLGQTILDSNIVKFTINGIPVSLIGTHPFNNLQYGSNEFDLVVTNKQGISSPIYKVFVFRKSTADLTGLSLSAGNISPNFVPNILNYTDSVSYSNSTLVVNPTALDPKSKILVNGSVVVSGSGSAPISLNPGANSISIQVISSDGLTQKTYTIQVIRFKPSSDATLSSLTYAFDYVSDVDGPGGIPNVIKFDNSIQIQTPFIDTIKAIADVYLVQASAIPSNPKANVSINFNPAPRLVFGYNVVKITVTAEDGITQKVYTLVFLKANNGVSLLSTLNLSSGKLSPALNSIPNNYNYTDSVPYSVNSITINSLALNPYGSITVQGNKISEKTGPTTDTSTINLNVGSNIVTITVQAPGSNNNGVWYSTNYTVNIVRSKPDPVLELSSLSISPGKLIPQFSSNNLSYYDTVANNVDSVSVMASTNTAHSAINVYGYYYHAIPGKRKFVLNTGNNTLYVELTDTINNVVTTKDYTIYIYRPQPEDLLDLSTSAGSIKPNFSSGIRNYTLNVDYNTSAVKITGTAVNPLAKVDVIKDNYNTETEEPSGIPSYPFPLDTGKNVFHVFTLSYTNIPSSPGFVPYTYNLTINRPSFPSGSVFLSGLTLYNKVGDSISNLKPYNFSSQNTTYFLSVQPSSSYILLKPFLKDSTIAKVSINGATYEASKSLYYYPLVLGDNLIKINVTPKNGGSVIVYTLTVTRSASNNANLSYLTSNPIKITPGQIPPVSFYFSPDSTSYSFTVPYSSPLVIINAYPVDSNQKVVMNGLRMHYNWTNPYVPSFAGQYVPVKIGLNSIPIEVTADDGITKKTYSLLVKRDSASSVTGLLNLSMQGGNSPISPNFQRNVLNYSAQVPFSTQEIALNLTPADTNSKIQINGVYSGSILTNYVYQGANYFIKVPQANFSLKVGDNVFTITVTSEDGKNIIAYTLHINRSPGTPNSNSTNSNANLSTLYFENSFGYLGNLNPVFYPDSTSYSLNVGPAVDQIWVNAQAQDQNDSVYVNGVSAKNLPFLSLNYGPNKFNILVVAEDGKTTKTYTVIVNRSSKEIPGLSFINLGNSTIYPNSYPDSLNINYPVPYSTTSITVGGKPYNYYEWLNINGLYTISSSEPIDLNIGSNKVSIDVFSPDGIHVTHYNLNIIRASGSSVATLTNLAITGTSIKPGFSSGVYNYVDTVAAGTSGVYVYPFKTDSTSTVTMNGLTAGEAGFYLYVPLSVGSNALNFVVLAQDGITTQTYSVNVVVPVSLKANKSLAVDRYLQSSASIKTDSLVQKADGIIVHSAVSPNGDGINDVFIIEGLENYPNNHLAIVNRSGIPVYEANGYSNTFNGFSNINGSQLPAGTYFYILDYTDGNLRLRKTGYLILKY